MGLAIPAALVACLTAFCKVHRAHGPSAHFAGFGVQHRACRWEDVLPPPFPVSIGYLRVKAKGRGAAPCPRARSCSCGLLTCKSWALSGSIKLSGKIVTRSIHAFAVTHHDPVLGKVDIFDAELDTLLESQTAAIEQPCHQARHSRHLGEHLACVLSGKNGR